MAAKNNKAGIVIIALAMISAVLFIGFIMSQDSGSHRQTDDNRPKLGGPFALTNHIGQNVTEKDYLGKLQLIYFGYTFCPDVCPTSLSIMASALDLLTPQERKKIYPIFITIDPERDTAEYMKDYIINFGDDFVGLTGTAEQVKDISKYFAVYYKRVEEEGASEYLMDHSSYTYLMDENGKAITVFRHGIDPKDMVQQLRASLKEMGSG